jgi:hypothetical protein
MGREVETTVDEARDLTAREHAAPTQRDRGEIGGRRLQDRSDGSITASAGAVTGRAVPREERGAEVGEDEIGARLVGGRRERYEDADGPGLRIAYRERPAAV